MLARIRTIKPDFFTSEDIVALSPFARLLYVALWCEADREGRLVWKPTTFKLRYFPGDKLNIQALGKEILDRGLAVLYGDGLAYIPKFLEHQHINAREAHSSLPVPDASARVTDPSARDSDVHGGRKERKGKEDASRRGRGLVSVPADWLPSRETVETLGREFALAPEEVERYVAAFHDACSAKGYKYLDFEAAFRNCVRQDWPKYRAGKPPPKLAVVGEVI